MRGRIIKELRAFALPAGFIAAGSLLVLLASSTTALAHLARPLAATLFFASAPLLAASGFGTELQHRTLSLILAQPISRTRIWLEKCAALLAAAVILGAWQMFVLDAVGAEHIRPSAAMLYFVAVVCAAPLWTLLAGSTIGGAAFTAASLLIVELVGGFVVQWVGGHEFQGVIFTYSPALAGLRLSYAAITLLAGWLVFERLQISSQMAGHVASPLPRVPLLREVLRCRRRGGVRNLLRKELRLQTPTLIVAAVFAACWLLAVALFVVSPPRHPIAEMTFTVLLAMYLPLALVIVSTVSQGEDNALGVHGWHLTLPVRPGVHWLVKLITTLGVAVITVVALPLAMHAVASNALEPTGWVPELPRRLATPLVAIACTLVLCFWCAALFGGPIRAAVAAMVIGGFSGAAALLVAEVSEGWALAEPIFTWVMVKRQLPPEALLFSLSGGNPFRMSEHLVLASLGLLCCAVLTMSLRTFRQGHVERRLIVRQVGTLAAAIVLTFGTAFGIIGGAFDSALDSVPVRELEAALAGLPAPLPGTGPVEVPFERIAPGFSPSTREWLRDSRIRVQPTRLRSTISGRTRPPVVVATVTFPNGREFKRFYVGGEQVTR